MKKLAKYILFSCLFSFLQASEDADKKINFQPRVSIVTSIFKGDDFISGFLSDITRLKNFDQFELILINAASPGNEEPIIKEYMKKFPNIVYKKLTKDPGVYGVWNMGIKMARAPLITNANLDDRRNPEALEIHAKTLEETPYIDLVYSDFYVTFEPNQTFEWNTHQYSIITEEFTPSLMYKCLPGPQPTWRKSINEKYGYFDETFYSGGDFEMWNRAVSMGSKFKKVSSVLSGLYYFNPKGISTNNEKNDIYTAELNRINEKYSYMWITHYQYFCTAADSRYYPNLLNLIGSIHNLSFNNLGEIAVFDLGLSQEQIEHLNKIEKVSIYKIELAHPDLLKQFKASNNGKMVAGWYAWKFVILKQALDLFPYVIWLDSGTTVLKPLDNLFKYIQQTGYFLCTMGDEKFYNQISHPIKWGATEYVKNQFNLYLIEKKWILDQEPLLSGTIGVSRKAMDYLVKPLYEFSKNLRLFEDDGTAPNGFGTGRHDQTILSVFAYNNGLTIHQEDYTEQTPMYLNIDGKYEELYITWNGEFVNNKTSIYNSRCDLRNYENYLKYIRYKN